MTLHGWRAWYANGGIFSSQDILPEDLPTFGMQAVVLYFEPPYREYIWGSDFIIWTGTTFVGSMTKLEGKVFPGSYISDEGFDYIQTQAMAAVSL